MANAQSKMIDGVEFKAPTNDTIHKLSDLPHLVPHTVVSKECKPTRYNSFMVTISDDDALEDCQVYMSKYIAKYALPKKKFAYGGLQKRSDGSGHSYHNIM